MTGTPHTSKLWSGLRLTANVNLFFMTDTRVTAQVNPPAPFMPQTVPSTVDVSLFDFFFFFFKMRDSRPCLYFCPQAQKTTAGL